MNRLLRLSDVKTAIGLERSTIYALIGVGLFPPQIKLGIRSVGWFESDIQAWIQYRSSSKTNEEMRSLIKKIRSDRIQSCHEGRDAVGNLP